MARRHDRQKIILVWKKTQKKKRCIGLPWRRLSISWAQTIVTGRKPFLPCYANNRNSLVRIIMHIYKCGPPPAPSRRIWNTGRQERDR